MAAVDTNSELADTQGDTPSAVDGGSLPFVGQWHTLISTTNWEKGRIISEWRAARLGAGEEASVYSDEAWSQLVGEVTSQHVGRLRRVFDRFGDVYGEYEGLYWSHFHAGLDWDDAEIWLEGALQNRWSVALMRRQHDQAHGEVASAAGADATVVESKVSRDEQDTPDDPNFATVVDPETGEVASATGPGEDASDAHEANDPANQSAAGKKSPKTRPFDGLAELPDDLADAFESMKLAILSHKLTKWEDVSRDDVLGALDALKQLALAPSE